MWTAHHAVWDSYDGRKVRSKNIGGYAFVGEQTGEPSYDSATHLLRAGVDINTIRAWLGHVSLNTANVYVEVDLEMKAKALATCEIRGAVPPKHWKDDVALMQFLRSL